MDGVDVDEARSRGAVDPDALDPDAVEDPADPDEFDEFDESGEFETVDGQPPSGDGLTDQEREVLAFERQWWRHPGAKEQAIRDRFAFSSTRYYQLLNRLLDNPAALACDPVLVKRLRRLREASTRARSGGWVA